MDTRVKNPLMVLLGGMVLAACAAPYKPPPDARDHPPSKFTMNVIRLQITGNPAKLDVQGGGVPSCPGNNPQQKGCIVVSRGNVGLAEFVLATRWRDYDLRTMWICVGEKPDNWKPDDCGLPAPKNTEFEVFSVAGTDTASTGGKLDLGNGDRFYLIDYVLSRFKAPWHLKKPFDKEHRDHNLKHPLLFSR